MKQVLFLFVVYLLIFRQQYKRQMDVDVPTKVAAPAAAKNLYFSQQTKRPAVISANDSMWRYSYLR